MDTSALCIESDWVNVDLAPERIDHHEAPRRAPSDKGVSEAREQLDDPGRVVKLDHEVEVIMLACLMTEQRVDTPAPVEPDIDFVGL